MLPITVFLIHIYRYRLFIFKALILCVEVKYMYTFYIFNITKKSKASITWCGKWPNNVIAAHTVVFSYILMTSWKFYTLRLDYLLRAMRNWSLVSSFLIVEAMYATVGPLLSSCGLDRNIFNTFTRGKIIMMSYTTSVRENNVLKYCKNMQMQGKKILKIITFPAYTGSGKNRKKHYRK